MKTNEMNFEKQIYKTPEIFRIELDNKISLALESTPPNGPGEGISSTSEYINDEPYRISLG